MFVLRLIKILSLFKKHIKKRGTRIVAHLTFGALTLP